MSILITGGAGYIGSHVVHELLSGRDELIVLDKRTEGLRIAPGLTIVSGDCADNALVAALIDRHHVTDIIHLAGSPVVPDSFDDPARSYGDALATRSLIGVAADLGVRNFILCSSAAVYGNAGPDAIAEKSSPSPVSPYGRSMLMSEMMLQDLAATSGLNYVILRAFNVAGIDLGAGTNVAQAPAVSLVRRATALALGVTGPIEVFGAETPAGDGTPIRDYLHVSDLARAHVDTLHYLRASGRSRIFNCGTGQGHSVLEVLRAIENHCGVALPIHRRGPRRGDPSVLIADVALIRAELGWSARVADIDVIAQHALAAAYRNAERLDMARPLVRLVAESGVSAVKLKNLIAGFAPAARNDARAITSGPPDDPAALPEPIRSDPPTKTLTIGMATYDDYDGVYFTLQALRLYHPDILPAVEFLIIDNNPGGPCGPALRQLAEAIPSCRYVAKGQIKGTTIRDWVFRLARGKYVLCLDCHVLVAPGALTRLLQYFEANAETNDLLQGPLIYDDLQGYATHFAPEWRGGMYGTWATDPAGADAELPPFEIPMQGMGLSACRRDAWPGFNPTFRGFGGEEGYIHEKIRQRGGRVLCLPFLRWMHRFNRPLGVPYPNVWAERVRNYLIGFREVGWDTQPVIDHFRALLGDPVWTTVVAAIEPALFEGPGDTAARPPGQARPAS